MSEEKMKLSRPLTKEEQDGIYKYILSQQASDDEDIEVVVAKAPFNGNLQLYLRCHAEHCPGDLFPEINEMVEKIKETNANNKISSKTIKNIIGDFNDFEFLLAMADYWKEEAIEKIPDDRAYWSSNSSSGIGPSMHYMDDYNDNEVLSTSRGIDSQVSSINADYSYMKRIINKIANTNK